MAVPELLCPQYLVDSASNRMRLQARPSRNVCERSTTDAGKMAGELHMIETMVCGYHMYKEIQCAAVGEELSCIRAVENHRDPFAAAEW